ncbi:MAG: GNAT family N-acetyltransferase [Caldiserica bacterium]|nr:GNAT family N-acetyltransferase [Caldisericota bacterium]
MKIEVERIEIRRPTYRYLGFVTVRAGDGRRYRLPMTGTVAQWLDEGGEYELSLSREAEVGFDDYALRKGVTIWPLFAREYRLERTSPLSGTALYSYRILAREARYERDYEAIVELEQYHYASDEELLALWHCEACDLYEEANARPRCPRCGASMRFHDLKSATRASRFLILELVEREPYEPQYVGYVRVDPPIPAMNRRLPDGTIELDIRRRVFPREWFAHPFAPREGEGSGEWWELQGEALKGARSPVARLARVVVHPDYRVDGLGQLAIRALVDWMRDRWVPDMRLEKEALETIAMMARYNPFMEKAGFVYLWDTGSGRPVLYLPLSDRARAAIEDFLARDPVAKGHEGRLYRPRFAPVEPLSRPIRLRKLFKSYSNELTLGDLSEPVRRALEAFGVRERLIQRYVIKNGEIEVPPGKVTAIVGASGSGKTTLLRIIWGLLTGSDDPLYLPDSGEWELPDNARVQLLIPGEAEPGFGGEPVIEALYRICGDEALAIEILNYAGISDAVLYRARYRELSTGQKERAKIAWALAHRPNLILIDEFGAHLDPATARRVARRMSQLAREKRITLVLVTHRREILDALEPDAVYMVGYGTLFRADELPDRGFRVKEPYATYIVEGKKRWEVRRYPTGVRGRVGVVSGGKVIGTVEILGNKGPFSVEELREHPDRHLADERFLREYAKGEKLYVWELGEARKFHEPVEFEPQRGQRTWVRLRRKARRPEREGDRGNTEGEES